MNIRVRFKNQELKAARKLFRDDEDYPLSQRKFAAMLGLHYAMYRQYEAGLVPTTDRLFALIYRLREMTGREYKAEDFIEILPAESAASEQVAA